MDRKQTIEALRNDIIHACGELTFEGLLLARNLIRSLVEQQENGGGRPALHSDVLPKASTLAPPLAKTTTRSSGDTQEAIAHQKGKG